MAIKGKFKNLVLVGDTKGNEKKNSSICRIFRIYSKNLIFLGSDFCIPNNNKKTINQKLEIKKRDK